MGEIKRDWDLLSNEQRRLTIDAIITYFKEELDQEIGIISAEHILDFFLRTTTSAVYNRALDDMKPFLEKNLESTFFDIDVHLRKTEL
ncbi:MAG: DUF2164 family protein, partial [Patescibacteria group bacterium]